MRPVQLIPEQDAQPHAVARDVPRYEPGPCDGCPYTAVCRDRGDATVFHVEQVRGDPLYCQKIDGHLVPCKARHLPDMEPREEVVRPSRPRRTFVVDASVVINAVRWQWEQCKLVLARAGTRYGLAMPDLVWEECKYAHALPPHLDVVEVDPDDIDPRIREAAEATQSRVDPEDRASTADLSLVQALVDHDDYDGLICEDNDLRRLHVPSIVKALTGREVVYRTSAEFVEEHPGWFAE